MNRRDAVKVLSVGAACSTTAAAARVAHNRPKEALDAVADLPPRKVIVATYGRDLDPAALPEVVVPGDREPGPAPFEGAIRDAFTRKAKEHRCSIVVPMYLREDSGKITNVGILVGRNGETVGIYRKLHLAVAVGSDAMEAGAVPGDQVPVFDCDFGKRGIQIWPTQSPGTAHPALRALQNRYYIVSSTWRHNASVFEPTGKITAPELHPPALEHPAPERRSAPAEVRRQSRLPLSRGRGPRDLLVQRPEANDSTNGALPRLE